MTISSTPPTHPWVKVSIQQRRIVRLVDKSYRYTAGSSLDICVFAADCTSASVVKNRLRMNTLISPRIFLSRDWQPQYPHCCGYHDMSPCAQAAYRGKNVCHYVRRGALLTRERQGTVTVAVVNMNDEMKNTRAERWKGSRGEKSMHSLVSLRFATAVGFINLV